MGWQRNPRLAVPILALVALAGGAAQGATERDRFTQAEQRDPQTGALRVEGARIHVFACDAAGENGKEVYVYEYAGPPRRFRAVLPPDYGTPIGGGDFTKMKKAVAAGCATSSFGPVPPTTPSRPTPTMALPQGLTVLHKAEEIWPTTLVLKSRHGNTGVYEGTDFKGLKATAELTQAPDGHVDMTIKVPANGYVGRYTGTLFDHAIEGEYEPSPGFGPVDHFKANIAGP